MSFHTTIARLREASSSRVRGEAPDTCRVQREDLRIALNIIDRLDADVRRADRETSAAGARPAPDVGWGTWRGLTAAAPPPLPVRNRVEITVPFISSIGMRGEVRLAYAGGRERKAHLSVDVGHPVEGGKAGAPLTVDGMRVLVDGLMDCIYAVERDGRIAGSED